MEKLKQIDTNNTIAPVGYTHTQTAQLKQITELVGHPSFLRAHPPPDLKIVGNQIH